MMASDNESNSRYRTQRGLRFVIIGIVNLWAAYFIFKIPGLTFHVNDRVVTYNRADAPVLFNAAAVTATLVAIFFLISGIRILIEKQAKASTPDEIKPSAPRRVLWGVFNIAVLLFVTWSGYVGLTPERLRATNPDLVLCIVTFVAITLVA